MTLPLPPMERRFMGEDDDKFNAVGDGIVVDMIELCALRADAVVLDVGSHNADDPLHAIGFTPAWIRTAVAAAGLRIFAVRLGTWCGRPGALGYQDTFVLELPA